MKMKIPIYLFSLLVAFMPIFSQAQESSEIEEVKELLVGYDGDSLALYNLELARLYYHLDRDSSLRYNEIALKVALRKEDKKNEARAKINIALIRVENNRNEEADALLNDGLKAALEIEDDEAALMALANLGTLNHYKADYNIAVEYYLKSIEYAKKIENEYEVSRLYYNIADVFNQNKITDKRNEYYRLAMRHGKTAFPSVFVLASVQIADYFEDINQDSTKKYIDQAFELEDQIQAPQILTELYAAKGGSLQKEGNYLDARTAFLMALDYGKQLNQDYMLSACYCNLGENAMLLNNFEQSTSYFDLYQKHHEVSENVYIARDCLMSWSQLEKKKGNFKRAHALLYERTEILDSIYSLENRNLLVDLETKYETAKKEAEIQKQQSELDRKTYQRNLLFGGLGLFVLLSGSFIWGLFSRSNRDKKIAIQAQNIQTQKIESLEQEKKLLSMSSLLEGQETERIRIAKDLHDGLGGLLTTVKAHFGKIQSEIEKVESLDIYKSANQMIDKAHDEVRRISHNLMPSDLRAGGLPVAVRQLVHEMKTVHELNTDFEMIGFNDARIDEKVELSSYRIIQELTNNMLKYANANHAFIQISKFENEIQIVVEDDGVGFDYEKELESSGLGLKSIQNRVDQLGGHMDVVSEIGKGTSVTINVPLG